MNLSEKIKNAALNLGFDLVGVTDVTTPGSYPLYQQWVEAGHHGQMKYLSSDRALSHRENLERVLPGCRSILVLGKRINPSADEQLDDLHGRVASYAWNLDYHDVFIPMLKELSEQIESIAGKPVSSRYYTDTGPILERDLASRAGLGWIGRNSMLINPEIGSFFLLAEILLDLELEPDPPFTEDHCGQCNKCIEACPTQCILSNRTLESQRCLSYLTIELKHEIPVELRPLINEWVFGCDICQQVCPWNLRHTKFIQDTNFAPREGVPKPDLISELSLTPEDFNKKFKGSPVKRTKRRGYLRNIVTFLGTTKRSDLIPHFSKLQKYEAEPLIRQHSAWALGQIGGSECLSYLEEAMLLERDESVVIEIREAIDEIRQTSS